MKSNFEFKFFITLGWSRNTLTEMKSMDLIHVTQLFISNLLVFISCCLYFQYRIKKDVFPKFVMKINRDNNKNEIKFYYNIKNLLTEIENERGNVVVMIQNFIIPRSKQASLLRYEVTDGFKTKAFILLNQYDITSFPYL